MQCYYVCTPVVGVTIVVVVNSWFIIQLHLNSAAAAVAMNVVDQSVLRQYCSIFLFFLTAALSSGTAIAFNIINQTSPLLLIHLMHRPNIYHSYCSSVGAWKVLRLVLRLLLTPHFLLMWCMLLLHNSIWIFETSPVESSSIDTVRWHSTAYLPAKYLADWRLSRRLLMVTTPDAGTYSTRLVFVCAGRRTILVTSGAKKI